MTLKIFAVNIIILFIFTVLYEFSYRWNKQFLLNRFYLISSVLLSIIIPFISFNIFPYKKIIHQLDKKEFPVIQLTETTNWVLIIYLIGFGLSILFFAYKIIRVVMHIRKNNFKEYDRFKIANNHSSTFSFFKYIFIQDENDSIVLNHEIAHATKYHTMDILFIELAKGILWFNPFIYIIKFYIQENHEFEADYYAMKNKNIDEVTMAEYLLNYTKNQISNQTLITNNFFSLTKNRINMLAKHKFNKKVSYLLTIPVFLIVLSAFSFKSYPVYITSDGQIVQDTLIPGIFKLTDTIVVYDTVTYKESIRIVKYKTPIDEYIDNLNLSGKMWETIDTVVYYDPDTKKESLVVYKTKYPFELRHLFHSLTMPQQEAIIKNYGSSEKVIVKDPK